MNPNTRTPEHLNTHPHYRFGFVLTTAAGNMTRYLNLRKYAERDPEVECLWAPVSHYLEPDPYRRLPMAIRTRLIVRRQAAPVMRQLGRLDAVMYHVFEPYVLSVLRRTMRRRPAIVWSQDDPPIVPESGHPEYGGTHVRAPWRMRVRTRFDVWCARRVSLFVPWSSWSADVLTRYIGVPPERVRTINVGIDLELWPFQPRDHLDAKPRILFVGGDFVRKGGDLLLDVYRQRFADTADLHLVTKNPPADLPPGVCAHTDFMPNDPRLRNLYAASDFLVVPTRADMSSIASMEAMATGLPVIATRMCGIPDIVRDGETGFLIDPCDGAALAEKMEALLANPGLRRCMGDAGRAHIEREFDSAITVPRILRAMKETVDRDTSPA